MNICFISNFSKTALYTAVARSLESRNINVFWIACNRRLYEKLCLDFGSDRVLLVNRQALDRPSDSVGDFKLNELVYGDRVLRHDYESGVKYLTKIQKPIYNFLESNRIFKVFGEVTWAHELLIHRMCCQLPELNCQFLNPHVVRIPDQRFAFFKDEKQSQILDIYNPRHVGWRPLVPKPPGYLNINRSIQSKAASWRGKLSRVKRFINNENMDVLDPTLNNDLKVRIRVSVKEEFQRMQYGRVQTASNTSLVGTNYLFLGLHKQPEASVDVLGRYFEDQFQNILNLWRALPAGWSFVIKEHSIAIGDRALAFYKKIQALPGVVLIDEKVSSYELIKHARLVATVSGTIAYEAAIMGIPAVTFSPTFFNKLNRCQKIGLAELDEGNLDGIAARLSEQPDNLIEFSEYIYTNSFAGNVLDPISDPEVLVGDNIERLTEAFEHVIHLSEISLALSCRN